MDIQYGVLAAVAICTHTRHVYADVALVEFFFFSLCFVVLFYLLTNSQVLLAAGYCDAVQFDDRKFCFWLIMRKFFFFFVNFVFLFFCWSKSLRMHTIFPQKHQLFIFIHVSSSLQLLLCLRFRILSMYASKKKKDSETHKKSVIFSLSFSNSFRANSNAGSPFTIIKYNFFHEFEKKI